MATTADGGAVFVSPVIVDSWHCGDPQPAALLAFDDHGDGFLYDPALFTTHDGGRKWATQTTPFPVVSVEALGESVWMVEADCPAANQSAGACRPVLQISADGGRTFKPPPTQPAPGFSTTVGSLTRQPDLGQSSLVRIGLSAGYLVGPPQSNPNGEPDAAPIWATSDAGSSWTASEIPCSQDAEYVVVSAAPNGVLWAICAGEPSAGEQTKTVLTSSDAGIHWRLRAACDLPSRGGVTQPNCVGSPPDAGYLGDIDAVSADTAYLVGGRSSLSVSRDAGATWQQASPMLGSTGGGTLQVIFFNTDHGLVLGDDDNNNELPTLWSTSDAGQNWTAQAPRIS